MATTTTSAVLVPVAPVFTNTERLALARTSAPVNQPQLFGWGLVADLQCSGGRAGTSGF